MNEIVIRIEGLDRLVEVLQALADSWTGEGKPRGPQPQTPTAQMPQAVMPTMLGAPASQAVVPRQIPPYPGAPAQGAVSAPSQQSVVPMQPPVAPMQQSTAVPQSARAVPVQQPAAVPQPGATVPVQQPGAVSQPAPVVPPQQIPTTAAPEQYSFDKLAVALSNVCMLPDGQPKVHALLQQFGVNALFDLPKDKYGDFATALRGIGGVI